MSQLPSRCPSLFTHASLPFPYLAKDFLQEIPRPLRKKAEKLLAYARKRGYLSGYEKRLLANFFSSLIREVPRRFFRWKNGDVKLRHGTWIRRPQHVFCAEEPGWTRTQNIRKIAWFFAAVFVNWFRPGSIDWETPNQDDMAWVWKFVKSFVWCKTREGQARLIGSLFDQGRDLKRILKSSPKLFSPQQCKLLLRCDGLKLKGEKRARWLMEKDFGPIGGRSPLEAWYHHDSSFRAALSACRKQAVDLGLSAAQRSL